jgi:hypothetical protein
MEEMDRGGDAPADEEYVVVNLEKATGYQTINSDGISEEGISAALVCSLSSIIKRDYFVEDEVEVTPDLEVMVLVGRLANEGNNKIGRFERQILAPSRPIF